MATTKEKPKFGTHWCCDTCDDKRIYTHLEFVEHLRVKHNLIANGVTIHMKMLLHMDGSDWYMSTHEVEIPNGDQTIKAIKTSVNKRRKDDLMRFNEG